MDIEKSTKAVSAVIASVGLLFGIFKYIQVQQIEAKRPFLEKKLAWCEQLVNASSNIATSQSDSQEAEQTFWQLYFGVIGMVEGNDLIVSTDAFADALDDGLEDLGELSRDIAVACRNELGDDWSASWY